MDSITIGIGVEEVTGIEKVESMGFGVCLVKYDSWQIMIPLRVNALSMTLWYVTLTWMRRILERYSESTNSFTHLTTAIEEPYGPTVSFQTQDITRRKKTNIHW
jgi:hypothetical protein